MPLAFTKMHGLGNDFVMIDAVSQSVDLGPDQIRQIADRHFGIGCDQLLLVERPRSADTDFYYRIFNADGAEVEQCGNGARCFARFVREKGLNDSDILAVGTLGGPIYLYHKRGDQVRVNMGTPAFDPARVPFTSDHEAPRYDLAVDGHSWSVAVLSMGNPHAVLVVDAVEQAPVETLGPLIEQHPRFPDRTNVGFMAVRDRQHIDLRVFERGAGETLACGTGACAAVVAGQRWGLLDSRVRVRLPGGELVISWDGEHSPVWMTGPATTVYEGMIEV